MGCGSSSRQLAAPVEAAPVVATGRMIEASTLASSRGKGKGRGKGESKAMKFQIKLGNEWKDYSKQEDCILKRAYLIGQPNVKFNLRGQRYTYDFREMKQLNVDTGKHREIRPPHVGVKPPKKPLLPTGPMVVLKVESHMPGKMIIVPDPNNPGKMINVFVPPRARPGQKMAIPVPGKGESVHAVHERQKKHEERIGWSTGAKVAAGGAGLVALGAVGVGGVILGDHLAGGELASDIGELAVDAAEDIGDGVTDAVEAVGDWVPEAAEDIAEFAEDAIDWLGDAGEDVGDFIMDLF
mmetsp:Transcript_88099/g.139207  ORF Transcript_88099/g.139207 Transcript_88099/m.139207 type:complete len:296 (+) Transcript_88099:68-955(+)